MFYFIFLFLVLEYTQYELFNVKFVDNGMCTILVVV